MGDIRNEGSLARRSGRGLSSPGPALQPRNARAMPGADFPLVNAPPWPFEDADPLTDRARRTLAEGSFYWRSRQNGKRRKEEGGAGVWVIGLMLTVGAVALMAWRSWPNWAP
jgi:hypothetical protein